MFEITPDFELKSKIPLYIQLADYIKREISNGNISGGEKLPSKRNLSTYLGLSINTIQASYDQLIAEGYVKSLPRKGLYVTKLEEKIYERKVEAPKKQKIDNGKENLKIKIDFSSGKVDLENFPYSLWRKLTIESIYADRGELFYTGDPQGEQLLREEIAKYLFESRGVRCSGDQIVLGAGTQLLIGLLCLVIGKEYLYAIEEPGFHRTREVLRDQSLEVVPIPLDQDGICMNSLKSSRARIVYVTPSHQFPYGMVMPVSRRMELLNWAEEMDGYIIEDDYDGEFRYKGKPIPSLQGLDINERVVYLGTFSKSLIPSIRISYLVLPKPLLIKYKQYFTVYKQTVSRLHQDTLFRFMSQGHWERHLNKMRTLYRKKHNVLLTSIEKYMGNSVTIIGERAGLHILIRVKNEMSEKELVETALTKGVRVYPVSIYYRNFVKTQNSLILLGFGGLTLREIEEGIRALKYCWHI
jgi:GntR family transcriptional regulator/MocR family aminotransferase